MVGRDFAASVDALTAATEAAKSFNLFFWLHTFCKLPKHQTGRPHLFYEARGRDKE